MKPTDRQKVCANCDGRISYDSTICTYCGAEVAETDTAQMQLFKHQALQESLTSLYSPPYSKKAAEAQTETPEPVKKRVETFKEVKTVTAGLGATTMQINNSEGEAHEAQSQSGLLPILFLSIGSNLCLLGLLQFFFSEGGFLKLEWDASYWFIYCLISLPLIYFGMKKASPFKK
ncbi:MAG: hypothetical protein HYX48_02650 [Chlamydiales bacterium]|nr:hypothetical protein [Chlamydiales bacterium]